MKGALKTENLAWYKLVTAINAGDTQQVQSLLAAAPALIYEKDSFGETVLHKSAYSDHEKVAEMLIAKEPKLIDAVTNDGKTALQLAAHWGHKKVVETLTKAKNDLAVQSKDPKVEENKTANKSDQESNKFHYSQEKIHKILSSQLQNEKNVNVELLDLSNPAKAPTSQQQLQSFVESAIKGNKTLAMALHLHGEAWASLVIKHIGDNNLQIIYNDPTGNAFNKEPAVLGLISSLTEQNQDGDTTTTDLRKSQQRTENDSGAIIVDNLVKLATAKSFKKADLQKLLLGVEQVNELKVKHLLTEETRPEYSDHKLKKLLELSLKDKPAIIATTTIFENKDLLIENTKVAAQQVMNTGVPIIMSLFTQDKSWSGVVIKKQLDGSLQVIYSNPTGASFRTEKNSMKLIKAIMDLNSDVHIIDLKYKQNDDKQASGSLTVSNLIKLALSETADFRMKDFQKLLFSTSENIDQLRQQHDKLIHNYIMPNLLPEVDLSILRLREERDPFEHKGDWSEGKEGHIAPPPYGEEDNPVQMHVLGDASANQGEHAEHG